MSASCPSNAIQFNRTLCACAPGYLLNATSNNCTLFTNSPSNWVVNSGIDYSISFPETVFSFDQIKKFTQSQAVFLEATAILLASWLLFCVFVRFGKLSGGRSIWFQIRWWISRLDVCFATRHWLEDQKVVRKRKTELGGAFSVASWILFIGLFAALLYQIISKRSVEVHNLRATNAPDLVSFVNDLEFNITTISAMSCSQLRGLGTIFLGNPGSIDYRVSPLSTFANYSCLNTTLGPKVSLRCNNCPLVRDSVYISWQFVDVPGEPASAVAFEFNLSARYPAQKKHMSLVSGVNIMGPVSFLADLGGLYCISIGIFFYLLVQCEYRVKRLRNEDQVFRNIRSRCKAKAHWDKLRKYVMYTWGPSSLLEENYNFNSDGCCACAGGSSLRKGESLHTRTRQEISLRAISFDKKDSSHKGMAGKHLSEPAKPTKDDNIPLPPSLPELNGSSTVDLSDIQKNLQELYKYNTMLRKELVNTQSMLRTLTGKHPPVPSEGQT
ncbi:hypothetical protein BVRB_4g080840 [Beta vulgaris subsp. vulgaris]|nr:hypothetical protein BVRB_4g080840 [Beta vulgaris subsp. vulgaris]